MAMGAVRADWPGRVSVVAGQIPGAGQARGAARGGRDSAGSAPGAAALRGRLRCWGLQGRSAFCQRHLWEQGFCCAGAPCFRTSILPYASLPVP